MAGPNMSMAFDCAGRTTTGEHYGSISAMWQSELSDPAAGPGLSPRAPAPDDKSWYARSARYWQQQAASVEGMLGGLGELDARDVAASRKFLASLSRDGALPCSAVALDVGAGIGRVTKHLLLPLFDTVDMLEQNLHYLEESRSFVAKDVVADRVEKRIACGMQDFCAKGVVGADRVASSSLEGRYHLVWIQWCIIYLTDDDLVAFLRECSACLAPGGLICLKDNVARSGFLVDKEDSSVMRSDRYLKHLFRRAGVEVLRETKQIDFPRNIFPVRTYALKPAGNGNTAKDLQSVRVTKAVAKPFADR